jgi:Uma2 family endonuclease
MQVVVALLHFQLACLGLLKAYRCDRSRTVLTANKDRESVSLSYYIGDRVSFAPQGSSVVDLDSTPAPDLAIEIADTSLADDLGVKRLLYEDVGVAEYWVVDVQQAHITAFRILPDSASQRIAQSQVLPGLAIALLEEALQRSRQMDNSLVGAWFLAEVQK